MTNPNTVTLIGPHQLADLKKKSHTVKMVSSTYSVANLVVFQEVGIVKYNDEHVVSALTLEVQIAAKGFQATWLGSSIDSLIKAAAKTIWKVVAHQDAEALIRKMISASYKALVALEPEHLADEMLTELRAL